MDNRSVVFMPLEDKVNLCREQEQKSIQELAEQLGCSRPQLSKVLSGTHKPAEELKKKMEEYAAEVEKEFPDIYQPRSNTFLKSNEFFVSRDASNIIGVCAACQENSGLGVITGRSGFGKTHALKHFAQMPNVVYVECNIVTGHKELLIEIETANRLYAKACYGTLGARIRNLSKFYRMNPGSLIIIDEADKLINKYGQTKIELVRTIFDQANVGIVLAGEPSLRAMLENYSDRLANRVDFYYDLGGLGKDEVRELLSKYYLEEDALQELITRACNKKSGCFRLLDRTLNNIERLMKKKHGDTHITLDVIREASSLMML